MDYLEIIRQAEEAHQHQPLAKRESHPVFRIIWPGADGKSRGPATVEFLHTDSDGTVWAFVTFSDGLWAAVNTKYTLPLDEHHGRAGS